MKYPLTVLSALLLLASCSGETAPEAESNQPAAIVVSEAEADAEEDPAASEVEESEPDQGDADEENGGDVDQKNVKLEVSNQQTFGQITIKKVETARDGWVSIHKSKADGSIQQPSSIGEARVDSGDNENIVVDLWEAPAVGNKLWVLLHIDAGERGTYEYPGADALVTKNSETTARSFVIKDEGEEESEE